MMAINLFITLYLKLRRLVVLRATASDDRDYLWHTAAGLIIVDNSNEPINNDRNRHSDNLPLHCSRN